MLAKDDLVNVEKMEERPGFEVGEAYQSYLSVKQTFFFND